MTTVEDDVNQSSVQINGTCLDLLLIELVPMASRMADRAVTERAYLIPSSDENDVLRADERRTAIQNHLDELGYRVGQAIVEQYEYSICFYFLLLKQRKGSRSKSRVSPIISTSSNFCAKTFGYTSFGNNARR